jgi:hypothetical protein
MDYTTLSLADVRIGLDDVARDVERTFGGLSGRQLNWRQDATRWSVGQCLEHLLASNRLMFSRADDALNPSHPRTIWQRLPGLPGLFGKLLVRSQAPDVTRRYKAPAPARPSTSDISPDVVQRFVAQHREAVDRVAALDEGRARRAIMTSPFSGVITYRVLDGWRLILTHDRRHVEQARRVTQAAEFPKS